MISRFAHKFCKPGLLYLVENYDAAVADTTQVWDLHHRLELTPGFDKAALRRKHLYKGVNPEVLIFLTRREHSRIHEHKPTAKALEASAERRRGKPLSDEHRAKISAVFKGKPKSEETRRKMSEAAKRRFEQGLNNLHPHPQM